MRPLLMIAVTLIVFAAGARADIYADCEQVQDPDRTIRGCTQIIERGEQETREWRIDAYFYRGNAYLDKGEYDRAIADNTRAIELDPNDTDAYYIRGLAYEKKGDREKAGADYRKVLDLEPSAQDAKDALARLNVTAAADLENSYSDCEQREDLDRRIRGCTQVIERGEREPREDRVIAHFYRGYAYSQKKDYDRAIADYDKVIVLDPNVVDAYYNRGLDYESKGNRGKALLDFRKAHDLDPSAQDAKNALARLSTAAAGEQEEDQYRDCKQRENTERTIHGCTQIIGRGEQESREWRAAAYVYRGNAYSKNREHDRAIADYNNAIELDPNDAVSYNNRGLAYFNKGEYERAIADGTTAIKLDPKYAMAYNSRGLAHEKHGDREKAVADYRKALEIDPENQFAKNALNALETAPLPRDPVDQDVDEIGFTKWMNENYNSIMVGTLYRVKKECDRTQAANRKPEETELCEQLNAQKAECEAEVAGGSRDVEQCRDILNVFSGKRGAAMVGTWRGHYMCAQGKTGVDVEIKSDLKGRLTGEFHFFPLPENPGMAEGIYTLNAKYQESMGIFEFSPDQWKYQSRGYSMVGFSGSLNAEEDRFHGRVLDTACGDIQLWRHEPG